MTVKDASSSDTRAEAASGRSSAVPSHWAALGVRAEEVRPVRGLFRVSVLLGLGLVAFYGSSNALFLTNYDIDVLPWVYIVNAVLVIVVGLIYSAASRRLDVQRLLSGSTIVIAATVLGLWLWAVLSDAAIVTFVMATWFRMLFIFALLGLWEIASTIFNVRQAKRLFPAVALGAMVAFVVGGALTGPITALIGITNMVLVSGICFVLYAAGFRQLLKAEMSDVPPDTTPPAGPRAIVADRYSRLLAAMRSVTILLTFVGEFIFYEQSAATFEDEDSLAAFLGFFIAGSTLLMVVVTAALAARYIARFGLRVGLMTMPAAIGVTAVAVAAWGLFVGVDTVFFVLVVLSMVTNTIVGNAIETPVGAVMYQPLPNDRRMPIRVAVDGWLGSVALFCAGFLLLGFEAVDFDTVVPFAWLLAVIGLVGVWLAQRLYLGYTHELRSATTRAFSGDGALPIDFDDPTFDAMATGGPTSVLTAGAILALGGEAERVDPLLDSMLDHPDPVIVEVAITSIAGNPTAHAARAQQMRAVAERSDVTDLTRGHALRAFNQLDAAGAQAVARSVRPASSGALHHAATAILFAADPTSGPIAREVEEQLASDDVADRLAVARMAGCADEPLPTALVEALLCDPHDDVRLAAVQAVDGNVSVALAPLVIEAGQAPSIQRHAVRALAESNGDVLDAVVDAIDGLETSYQAELISQVYPRHTRRPALLHPFVAPAMSSRIRQAGFSAIQQADIAPPASPERMLRDDVDLARQLASAWRDIAADAPELGWAVAAEFESARASIYQALAIGLPAHRIHDIQAIAAGNDDDDRANAIEALDVMLESDVRRLVIPILEPISVVEAIEEFTMMSEPQDVASWTQSLSSDTRLNEWTRRTARHHLGPQAQPTTDKDQAMSEIIERIVALKGVDIFSTLPYPLLAELAEGVSEARFEAGDLIISKGALDQEVFALTSGSVRVANSDGTDVVLEAGTVFGELAVLDPAPRSADVTAVTPCDVLVVRRKTLLALADRRPEVMVEIAGVLAKRLRSAPIG